MFDWLLKDCWTCWGKGFITVPGPRYSKQWLKENDPSAWADIMVNGGWYAPALKKQCPNCSGTGARWSGAPVKFDKSQEDPTPEPK
jgi:hypothetical protein